MNDREELIQELMKNPIGKDETFYFKCRQCGECCKNRVDILLSPFDLCRIAKALGKHLHEVYLSSSFFSKIRYIKSEIKHVKKCAFIRSSLCR